MTHYCPWRDVGERHADVLIDVRDIAPAKAVWLASPGVIFIDSRLSRAAGRSALAHEIAHIDLGHKHSGFPWFDARQEREADVLAARRLIPIASLADAYTWTRDEESLAEILNVDVATVDVRFGCLHPAERHFILERIASVEHAA